MVERRPETALRAGDHLLGVPTSDPHGVVSGADLGLTGSERQVYRALWAAIVEHRVPPGAHLAEEELAGIYAISRMRVRRVLLSLSSARVVTLFAGRGAFVSKPAPAEARAVFAARRTIETAVLSEMDRPAAPGLIARLQRNVSAGRAATLREDRTEAIRLSGAFHVHIMAEVGNAVVAGIVEELVARSSLVLTLYMRGDAPVCHDDHHAKIVETLGGPGFRRAASQMRRHLTEIEVGLDLGEAPERSVRLREILLGTESSVSQSSNARQRSRTR